MPSQAENLDNNTSTSMYILPFNKPAFIKISSNSNANNSMGQLTSVSQLKDIGPRDWSFEALKELVERYGCIAGYPNRTFQGDNSMSRYEFAAALNSCLQALDRNLQTNLVAKEDLEKLKRLEKDFQPELSSLSVHIDRINDRVSYLENHQFSSTTKIHGNISLNLLGNVSGGNGTQAMFQQLTYVGLSTSFTGKDLLYLSFNDSNTIIPNYIAINNGINYSSIGGFTREGLTSSAYGGPTNNLLYSLSAEYIFPVIYTSTDKVYVTLAANNGFNTSQYIIPNNGLSWEGSDFSNNAISAFGQRNPIYRLGGGQGTLINYVTNQWEFTAGYLAGMGGFSPNSGQGLFNGNSLLVGQVNYSPNKNISVAFNYSNNYFAPGTFAFDNQYQFYGNPSPGYVGTGLANTFSNAGVFFNQNASVVSNTFAFQGAYRVTPKFIIGGFGAKISAICQGLADAQIWTYAINFGFLDLGKEGNIGGIIVGVEPTLTGLIEGRNYVGGFKNSTGLHIEAYYKYQVVDNLSVTPGIIIITAPNQDSANPDIIVGVVRTTFSF
jgi:hypothetical protein